MDANTGLSLGDKPSTLFSSIIHDEGVVASEIIKGRQIISRFALPFLSSYGFFSASFPLITGLPLLYNKKGQIVSPQSAHNSWQPLLLWLAIL